MTSSKGMARANSRASPSRPRMGRAPSWQKPGGYWPFFLSPLKGFGPVADWGLNLHENLIRVDTERKFETGESGIFAVATSTGLGQKLEG